MNLLKKLGKFLLYTVGALFACFIAVGIYVLCTTTADERAANVAKRAHQEEMQKRHLLAQQRDTLSLQSLRTLIRQEYRQQEFDLLARDIRLVLRYYPQAPEHAALTSLLPRADSLDAAQQQREARKQKRREGPVPDGYYDHLRLLRGWRVQRVTDKFGDKTTQCVLTNSAQFDGQHSTVGSNESLAVDLLVDSAQAMHLRFRHETYHRGTRRRSFLTSTSPYTDSQTLNLGSATYEVAMRTDDGRTYDLAGTSTGELLHLTAANAQRLHQLLEQGGHLRFVVNRTDTPEERYAFTILDADMYEEAYTRLMKQIEGEVPLK